jgi:hypothetical protein
MLDFQKRKKKYFDIALHDGTKLKISTPTTELYGMIRESFSDPENVEEDDLRSLVKNVLSTNKQGIEITDEQVEEFDLEDMYLLFTKYVAFVQEVLSDPNSKSPIVP